MAITYNLPIHDWYYDDTSLWTLDYPPLFAALEFLLSIVAHLLNLDEILELSPNHIRTESCIIYQKLTVIISDLVYYYAIYKLCISLRFYLSNNERASKKDRKDPSCSSQNLSEALCNPNLTSAIALLLLCQPGLLMVDHIHFQYNGFLSGIFLLSVANVIEERYAFATFWFMILLNLKHIYLYYAPAYGMYTLVSYCLAKCLNQNRVISCVQRTLKLATIVLLVVSITYAPFADPQLLKQIINRMFPFKRGLTHAYWAPNFWSLYNTADKLLATIFKDSIKVNFDMASISRTRSVSSTSGLVQEYEHQYLTSIKPETTFILVGVFTLPLIIKFIANIGGRDVRLFLKGVTVAAFTSFMFGWHVHEKAIIMILLPLIPIGILDIDLRRLLVRISLAGTYSLFPLLFMPAEYPVKVFLLIAYTALISRITQTRYQEKPASSRIKRYLEHLYGLCDLTFMIAIIFNELYNTLLHGKYNYEWNYLARLNKYEFLPLMMTSCVSAVPILFSYIELYFVFLKSRPIAKLEP